MINYMDEDERLVLRVSKSLTNLASTVSVLETNDTMEDVLSRPHHLETSVTNGRNHIGTTRN